MTRLLVAAIAILIGISLSSVGIYQAKLAHHPVHTHGKRTG